MMGKTAKKYSGSRTDKTSKRLDVGSRGMERIPDPSLASVLWDWVNEQRGSRFGRGGVK